VLLAKDLAAAREFYHDKLGLEILTDNENAIVFQCGGGTHLDVTKSTVGTADEQTQASWQVSDIRAEVAELRARGVKVEDYDMPGLKTEDGIADIGFAWAAWIIDPGKNALASCSSSSSRASSAASMTPLHRGSQWCEERIGLAQPLPAATVHPGREDAQLAFTRQGPQVRGSRNVAKAVLGRQ
jgi:catechol 2,3-dioxygenase-like lactoylglutathione lyase family enzyme